MTCAELPVGPGLPAGLCRGAGGGPARAELSGDARLWHWVLIHSHAWVRARVRAVGDTRKQAGNGGRAGPRNDSLPQLPVSQAGSRAEEWQERVRGLQTFGNHLNELICASKDISSRKLSWRPDVTLANVLRILVCVAACALRLWQ